MQFGQASDMLSIPLGRLHDQLQVLMLVHCTAEHLDHPQNHPLMCYPATPSCSPDTHRSLKAYYIERLGPEPLPPQAFHLHVRPADPSPILDYSSLPPW